MKHSNLQENAEQVSQVLSSTITSLAADVTALKHLTTWKDILDRKPRDGTIDKNGNDDNAYSTTNQKELVEKEREEFIESVCDLEDVVTSVEQKVSVLRQIVSEEQRALEELNVLQVESAAQNQHLRELIERCRQQQQQQQEMKDNVSPPTTRDVNSKNSITNAAGRTSTAVDTLHHHHHRHQRQHPDVDSRRQSRETSFINNSRESVLESHTQIDVDQLRCFLDPVSQDELESIPRMVRNRVTVATLNEALENIEDCFHKKAVKIVRQQQQLIEARSAALSNYDASEDEALFDETKLFRDMLMAESELRTSCSFFQMGEQTARTVFAILKALKRIKQVPNKKRDQMTYKLCLD